MEKEVEVISRIEAVVNSGDVVMEGSEEVVVEVEMLRTMKVSKRLINLDNVTLTEEEGAEVAKATLVNNRKKHSPRLRQIE